MSVLSVENISCHHGLMQAVHDVSFQMNAGEALCIIGANGAGKTTLMSALCGTLKPSSGKVYLHGRDVTSVTAHDRLKSGIAICPEGRRLFSDLTVKENLQIADENGREGGWTIEGVLEAFPQLKPLLSVPANGLSGGQRQAAAVGRALVANPDVLLLDEVSLGLSPVAVDGVYETLTKIRDDRDIAMLVVEQDLNRSLAFADRILCMSEGELVLSGKPDEFSKEQITQAYFGISGEDDV